MKIILLMLVLIFSTNSFAQEKNPKKPFSIEVGITGYGYNMAYGGFDIDFSIPFYRKGIHTLALKTSLMTLVPSSIFHSDPPYILFGGLWDFQYSISVKGFLFTMETGLGIASEFFQVPVFVQGKGFVNNFYSDPYGIFSAGLRMGYDFEYKYKTPIKFAFFVGYRMQFPFNFTIKHIILYGANLSYRFDFGGK